MCRWTFHKYSESQNNTCEDNKDEFSLAKDEDNVGKNIDPNIIPGKLYCTLRKIAHALYRDFFFAVKIEHFIRKLLIFFLYLLKT